MSQPQSLFDKIWAAHEVQPESSRAPAILYIDLHLIHEVTSPQGFDVLRERGIPVRRPGRTLGTIDHSTPTLPPRDGVRPYVTEQARIQVETLKNNCEEFGIELHGWDSPHRGIVHVIGPELGVSQPGLTIVCGDSHTSTHGAFGALAFGIGTTQVGHVLATQCLLMGRPKSMRVSVDGETGKGVTAKDIVLHIINHIGVDGGTGHVIEYAGSAIRGLSMEGRMTVCNMSIEAGARAGMVAPDATTLDYLRDRPKLQGQDFDALAERWLALASDADASYDRDVQIDAAEIAPRVTYGTHPGMSIPVDGVIPDPASDSDRKALEYMGLDSNRPISGHDIDVVFIGSCTNSRIEDLREAASVVAGKQVADGVDMLVVPGSEQVRIQAEAEGLHQIFENAGAQWRIPGCSMCLGMNGDIVSPGATAISTSNRNFEGRQGPGARTLLASPATAAASALAGSVADPRTVEISTLEVA
ncbi:MAG: 3-isopropylmalate dehydratase large subunit [Xanthomonadales bacterium]|nr:3-isopropylmalate dehydratase large subunit [Xanthomonadales bacterium]